MIGPYTEVVDRQVQEALDGELERQRTTIELIASENFASPAVLAAQGSVLTNKYAEGYPGKRYYGGCEQVDKVEVLAIERAKQLFGAEHVNVQPHSGSQAHEAAHGGPRGRADAVLRSAPARPRARSNSAGPSTSTFSRTRAARPTRPPTQRS